jgi:hypothetical protein
MTMEINNGYLQENGQICFLKEKSKIRVKESKAIANTVTMDVMKTVKIETIAIKIGEVKESQ